MLLRSYLIAADSIIIPVTPQIAAIKSLSLIFKLIENIKKVGNSSLEILGVLITMYRDTEYEKKLLQEIKSIFPKDLFFKKVVNYDESFEKANEKGVPQFLLNMDYNYKKDYFELAIEILEKEKSSKEVEYAELF